MGTDWSLGEPPKGRKDEYIVILLWIDGNNLINIIEIGEGKMVFKILVCTIF